MQAIAGIPETPAPRRNFIDKSYWTPQHKIEMAMHSMVRYVETNEKQDLAKTGALMRSAWEDCNESRRKVLAGKGKSTLSKGADYTRPRLMSTDEEDKVRRAKAQGTRQTASNWRERDEAQSSNRQRSWSTGSRGKGKGKCKGKGRSEQT